MPDRRRCQSPRIFEPRCLPEIIDRLHREIVRTVALPEARDCLMALGFAPIASSPKEFADRITWEIEKWAKVIRAAGIKAQ